MPINPERNLRARTALVELLNTGRAFAVTGAGLSVWAGYSTWEDLISRLAAAVRATRGDEVNVDVVIQNNHDLLHCARRLGGDLGRWKFAEFIRNEFGPRQQEPNDVLFKFISIPFRHILTFNFEESVERVHTGRGDPCGSISSSDRISMGSFLRKMNEAGFPRQVIHLHGKLSDELERIALTEEGYAAIYRRDPFFKNLLWLLFTSQTLVFVGFGLKDSDFMNEFRTSVRDLPNTGLCHFAIVGLRPEENDQQRRNLLNDSFMIEPIFYNVRDGEQEPHREFLELINGLADTVGTPTEPLMQPAAHIVAEAPAPDADDLQQAERLSDRFLERADPGGGDVQG